MAAAAAVLSVRSAKSTADPEPREAVDELGPRRAIGDQRRHDPVAGLELRGERGVDGAHARGEGDARFAPGELRVGRAEGGRRRVGDPRVGVSGARIGGDVAQLLGVGGGERRRLVDRHAGRAAGRRAGRAMRPGWPASRTRAGLPAGRRPLVVSHGVDATPRRRCYTRDHEPSYGADATGGESTGMSTPVTRFLPARLLRVHRAVGADHQLVGRLAVVGVADDADRQGRPDRASSARPSSRSWTPSRIFSATTYAPVGSVSGRSTTNSSPP